MSAEANIEQELKTRFAVAWLRSPDNTFAAAMEVFPQDIGAALEASNKWPFDDFVLTERQRLVSDLGMMDFLPPKDALARKVWALADEPGASFDERRKMLQLYAEVRGFIEKPGTNVNVAVINTHRTMKVRDHGNDDEWESKLRQQQSALTHAGTR